MAEEKDSNEKDDHLHVLFKKLKVNANWNTLCYKDFQSTVSSVKPLKRLNGERASSAGRKCGVAPHGRPRAQPYSATRPAAADDGLPPIDGLSLARRDCHPPGPRPLLAPARLIVRHNASKDRRAVLRAAKLGLLRPTMPPGPTAPGTPAAAVFKPRRSATDFHTLAAHRTEEAPAAAQFSGPAFDRYVAAPAASTPPLNPGRGPAPCSCATQALCDDWSVEELSCYFEDCVNIPRKMSAMAEMMYT